MLKVYVYYIYLLFVPINLTLFHDVEPVRAFDFKVLISLLILISIIFFTLRYNKNKILEIKDFQDTENFRFSRVMFFSVFWFFITLIPFSNILPLRVFMAERYLYLPSVAFSLLLSHLLITTYSHNFKNHKNKKIVK